MVLQAKQISAVDFALHPRFELGCRDFGALVGIFVETETSYARVCDSRNDR